MTDTPDHLRTALSGRYTIERELGSGGMATVYLAEDLKHHRRVALKLLRPELAAVIGADRFLREIEIAAGLTNPHILPLHDSGKVNGLLYYVMPFVEGESLRDRLRREKQLPIEQAVRIAREVALALSYAHEHGVVHRDIKPENILLSGEEAVVADFGIARAVTAAGSERLTETGLSLGTPQYMSPEQASGELEVDGRSDIYSLGCVLFEMLTGVTPHTGPTVQAIMAKVLTERPPDVRALRDTAPPPLARVIHKALARLPADRFSTAAHFADALVRCEQPVEITAETIEPPRPRIRFRQVGARLVWPALAALATALVMVTATRSGPMAPQLSIRFDIAFPDGFEPVAGFPPLAISPDGSFVVYAARRGSVSQLFLRQLDEIESRPLPGTEGAHTPFISPDGRWIGYASTRTIAKVAVSGGSPITVGNAPHVSLGASWAPGTIVFGGLGTGLHTLPEDGGSAVPLTTLLADSGEVSHGLPQLLPDGKNVMFTVGSAGAVRTAVVSLETGVRHWIDGIDGAAGTRYVPTGHLVFALADELSAVGFDEARLEALGSPVALVPGVHRARSGTFATTPYSAVSNNGTLAYMPGWIETTENLLVWVDREGQTTQVIAHRGSHFYPRLSPDGRLIAVQEANEIWVYDSERGTRNRLTSTGGTDPLWTPDARRVVFATGGGGLYWMPADGSGEPEVLLQSEHTLSPHSWSPDGSVLAFYQITSVSARDIWMLRRTRTGFEAQSFLATGANERSPTFSPDGRWIAYTSDESGRDEIYVRPYPGPGGKWPISRSGGREPVWSANGTELFYRQGTSIISVGVQTNGGIVAGEPRVMVTGVYGVEYTSSGSQTYDVAPDGQRFVTTQSVEHAAPRQIRVVLNWFEELKERVGQGND
jgi:serine/threonine-protein kinase